MLQKAKPEDNFRFLKFKVYIDAKDFYNEVVKLTSVFSRSNFEFTDQLRRAALSIMLNIAEGSAKKSDKDFNRYIKNALGSINECVACLDVAKSEKLINETDFGAFVTKAASIANQLGGFSKFLN